MWGIQLDVSHIIAPQIRGTFYKPRGQLFFPSIVTLLCSNMCFMEGEPKVVMNEVITNQVLRMLLRDSPHLLDATKTKKMPVKSQETSSPQAPKPKKRKLVKKDFKTPASSSQPIKVEEEVHLDAKASIQALTIYSLPISSI